jgi:hypothetical protein
LGNQCRLCIWGNGNIEHLNRRIIQEFLVRSVNLRKAMLNRGCLGRFHLSGCNRHWVKSSLAISHQVAIAHNKAATEATDAPILPFRQLRMNA